MTLLRRLVPIEDAEVPAFLWSFTYFFFLLGSYYVIRPLRDALGLSGREDALTWLFLLTLVGVFLLNPLFGTLVARFPRRVFVPVVYHVLALSLVVFAALLAVLEPAGRTTVAQVFFVWASIFNLFAVSVFWGFMADVWKSGQGQRLFGAIGVGGTLGSIAGSALTGALVARLGPPPLLVFAALLLEGAVFAIARLVRVARDNHVPVRDTDVHALDQPPPRGSAFTGLRLVLTRPYLLAICGFLLLYTMSSTFLYFEQARLVRTAFADAGARAAFFGRVDLAVNVLTVLAQVLLSGRVIPRLGVGGTLAILPLVTLGGFGVLGLAPVILVLAVFQVVRRATEYALVRPARETLFTVVGRDEKYTSKSFIDTFVYRGGDALGALGERALATLQLGAAGIALVFAPLAVLWLLLAAFLGKRQRALAAEGAGAGLRP